MSIHSGNVNEVGSLVHLAENLGATSVKFNLIQSAGRGGALAKRGKLLNIQRLIEIGNWIEKDLQSQVTMPLIYGWPIAFKSIKKLVNSEGIGTCTILNILGILPSGYLAMCGIGIQVPDLLYGLLGKDSIYDIWTKNSTLLDLRKKIPSELEGVCSLCILQGDCLGSCIAENYFTSQHLTAPFWFCQLAYEECIFPQTRLHLTEDTNHIHIDRDKEMQR
jgi:SynChlorMet cassette radical SAM/SPASM protein ScmF